MPPAPAPETLRTHAKTFIESKGAGWKPKHRAQWVKTVEDYLSPIADQAISAIDTPVVVECLKPLWERIPATAAKVRGMLEQILASATSLGLRSGANPARWRMHLENIMPRHDNGAKAHHAAMAYSDVPEFVAHLRTNHSTAALALEFCLLTATRTAETRLARWSEIDLDAKVWTIPAGRMKGGREHRVPLSDRTVEIIESLAARRSGDFIFAGTKANAPIGKMAMSDLMLAPATVHGMRSAFADFSGEEARFPRETIERALAHVVGNGTEQAYRRGDGFKHRCELMTAWANFCEHGSKRLCGFPPLYNKQSRG
jgi:integrase